MARWAEGSEFGVGLAPTITDGSVRCERFKPTTMSAIAAAPTARPATV